MKINKNIITNLCCFLYFLWGTFILLYQSVNLPDIIGGTLNKMVNIFVVLGLLICYIFILCTIKSGINFVSILGGAVLISLSIIPVKYQVGLGIILFTSFVFIVVAGNIEFDKILKTFICFSSIILIATILLNKLGKIHDGVVVDLLSYRVRKSLGFKYYSYPAHIIFYLICAVIVYRKDKISYIELIILQLLNTWIYSQTNTRASFILATLFVVYALVKKIFRWKNGLIKFKPMKILYSFSFIINFLLIWIFSFDLSPSLFIVLNKLFSGRLSLNVTNFSRYGIALFGRKITFNTSDVNFYNYVDSAYLQTLLIDGLIFFVVIMFMLTFATYKSAENNDDNLSMALLLISIFAMFDPQLIWPWYSPFCLLMGSCIKLERKSSLYNLKTKMYKS